MELLENKADVAFVELGALLGIELMNGMVKKVILPLPGAVIHPEDAEKKRFPCPGRSHDAEEFTFAHLQINPAQHLVNARFVLEGLFDLAESDHDGSFICPASVVSSFVLGVFIRIAARPSDRLLSLAARGCNLPEARHQREEEESCRT